MRTDDFREFCHSVNGEHLVAEETPGPYDSFKYFGSDERCTFNWNGEEHEIHISDDGKMTHTFDDMVNMSSIDGQWNFEHFEGTDETIMVGSEEEFEGGTEMWSDFDDGLFLPSN